MRGQAAAVHHRKPAQSTERHRTDGGVSFDGRAHRYGGYRYDRLADAVAYMELERARRGAAPNVTPIPNAASVIDLTGRDADAAMLLGVSFDGKVFRYLEYRCDHFADGCAYAVLDRHRTNGRRPDEKRLPG